MPGRNWRILSIGLLGFASGLPLALSGSALQAWFTTAGMSLRDIMTGETHAVTEREASKDMQRGDILFGQGAKMERLTMLEASNGFAIAPTEKGPIVALRAQIARGEESVTPEALCEFINKNAPHYFVPRYLEFVDALPYTPTNKVQKFTLRDAGLTPGTWDRDRAGFKVQKG